MIFSSRALILLVASSCGLFAFAKATAAADPDVTFTGGNRAYEDGRFADANQVYRSLISQGQVSEELFLNLGNVSYRLNQPGEAALWYRRALVLNPRFAEARQNLRVIKGKTGYHEFELKGVDAWLARLSPGELIAMLTAGLWIALLIVAASVVFRRLRDWRPLLYITGGLSLAVAIASFWGLNRQRTQLDADDLAIVTGNDATALTGPVPDAEKVVDLPPGSELQILQRSGPWTYVAIPPELRGWVRSESMAPVIWYGPHAVPAADPGLVNSGR
jgi:hypothetical protein